MIAEDRILDTVRDEMRRRIAEVNGNEVLFVGRLDENGMIASITIPAHGHRSAVPAPSGHTERGDVVIHNHPSGELTPSNADIEVAATLAAGGVGSFIVDNEVDRIYVVVEPVRARANSALDVGALVEILAPGGGLSRLHPGFEPRDSQMQMLTVVAEAFNEAGIAVVEAGTGTGKSFAYLIPAIDWVSRNEERVVISTATITLQQQLIEKDIPEVQKLLGSSQKAVLVKGRGNYLCPIRLTEAFEEAELFDERLEALHGVKRWAEESPTGSRSELPFNVPEAIWAKVNSDPDACTGMRCREHADCFVQRARREAAAARILVANHHLLFADLALRIRGIGFEQAAVLPPFQRLVLDEAHTIENSATSYFSQSFSRYSLARFCGRLLRSSGARRFGLGLLLQRLTSENLDWEAFAPLIDALVGASEVLNRVAVDLAGGTGAVRLPVDVDEAAFSPLRHQLIEVRSRVLTLVDYVSVRIRGISEDDRERSEVSETRQILRRLQEIASLCERLCSAADDPVNVYWIERRASGAEPFARFICTPVEVGPVLAEAVYEPFETVICTSATLTVDGTFDFWSQRVGLDDETGDRVRFESFPSPYRFDRQVLLAVPRDAPEPQHDDYARYLSSFVASVMELSEGSGLVLFTSYRMLDAVFAEVQPRLAAAGLTAFRQGDDDRSRLLRRFNAETSSVLFATDSFWEGVDAPGQTLRVVILCRLPFRVPSDPVLRARMDLIRMRGDSPFTRLSLPEAVIRLKQGFGRLMRRADDRGVVIVTDSRVLTKPYGPVFVSSLPQTVQSFKPADGVLEDIERFLY